MGPQLTTSLRLTADTTGFTQAIHTADASLQKLHTQAGTTAQSAQGLGQALGGAGAQAQGLGQQAIGAGGGADRLSGALGRVAHYGLAGVGLSAVAQAAASVGQALFQASARAQSLATQLNFATDGKAAQEMAFVTGVADRLGLQLSSTAQAYAGFAAAARGTALEGAPVRTVFESISKASAVMGLSAEQSSGALLAVQQMMGKGVVSAEEFRGQLGERMPIALQAGAQALGVTTAEFSKLLETGQIVAQDFLPKFAAAIDKMLAGSVEEAANRLDASAQRMGNAWDKLKKTVGDSGVSQAIGTGMTAASHDMNAFSEAMDRAKERGGGFFSQINQGLGVMIGRAVGLNYLSDAFRSNAERAAHLASALPRAEAELAALQARGAATSENIYLRSSYFDALRYTEELRAAKRAQDALQGAAVGGGRGVVNPLTVGAQLAQQQRDQEAANALRLRLSGVPDGYVKDMQEIIRLNQAGALVGKEYTDALAQQQAVLLKKTGTTQGAVAAQKTLQSAYESFLTGLHQKLAAQQQELATGAKVSEADQLRIRLQELLGTSLKGLGAEQRKVLEQGLQELAVGEKLARQYKQASELANARADARRQESQGIAQWLAEQEAAAQKNLADVRQRIDALTMEEDAARLAASTNVSLAEAVELVAIARLQEAQAVKFHEGSEGWRAIEREIAARRELLGLVRGKETREGIKKTADEAEKELKRVTEQYEQGLTNAAIQGGKSLREYIQGMLRATAFRIVLDPIMKPLAGLLAGVTGGSSAAASQGGGLMGTANLLSSAYSALTTGVSSSITAGFAKLAGSSFGQSIGLSNSSAIMGNNPSAFVPAGGQLTPLGQSIGTGLGMLGSGLAGYGISSAISNGYTTGGNTVNVLSGIASAFLGPIAGGVGGLINRAFGRKLKDTGIEGTIGGAAGFEGNSYQFYKGGWFRSDKTVRGELDAGVDKSLDTAVKQMQLSMAGLAMSIGAPTEAISSFSQAIKLSFNGLDEAGIQEKITQTLADYNEALASAFIASVNRSEVPKWVDRLLGNVDASAVQRLQAVSEWPAKLLQSIGTSRDQLAQLYAEGLASGGAAKAGQAVADSLVASIEASMLGNASAQVFDIVNQGIVTPMLDAILLGQNVSEALSEASIQKTIERAKETAAAFAELWNNAEFTAALEDIRTTVGSALGNAGAAMDYIPRYTQEVTDSGRVAADAAGTMKRLQSETSRLNIELLKAQGNTAAAAAAQRALDTAGFDDAATAAYDLNAAIRAQIDATNAAAAAAERAAEERGGLERQLMELQGDTVGLRARERNALDESNRALFDHVMALGDAARNTQLLRENTDSLVQSLASSVQSALSARNTAGSLLDRINGAIGGDGAAYAMRREQELWAAMSQASYKQQIELAGELTDSVLARMQLERESADKLTAIHRSLRDSIEATRLGALSPLTLGKKLQEASAQFEAAVAKARGGDTDAASQVVGLRETYLGLAQRYYAASDAYTTVFNASESAISGLAGTLQTESQRQLALSTDTLGALQQLRDVAQAAYSAADTDYTQSLAAMQEQSALLVSMDGGIGTLGDILSGLPADLAAQLQPLLGKGVADADVIAMLRGAQAASPGMMMGDLVAYGLGNGATAAQLAAVRTKLYSDAEVAEMLAQGRINYPGATDEQLQQLGLVQYGITEQQFKRVNGSHFNGLERVPFDGYIAQLHAREMVVPAQQADIFRSMDFSSFGRGVESMVGEIKSMRSELQSARAENAQLMAMLAKVMQSTSEGTAQQLRQAVRDVALAGVKPR